MQIPPNRIMTTAAIPGGPTTVVISMLPVVFVSSAVVSMNENEGNGIQFVIEYITDHTWLCFSQNKL